MFSSIDKALVAIVMGIVYVLSHFGYTVSEAWIETAKGLIVAATPFLVYLWPNRNTVYTDDPVKIRQILDSESGRVSIQTAVALVLTLLLIAACSDPKQAARVAALAQCSAQASAQGLELGSPERNAYVASCVSLVISQAVIENVILDDDRLGGGGKL